MSSPAWIPVWIHRDDEAVLAIAERIGEDPHTVVGRAVQWFRWCDQVAPGRDTRITPASMARICGADVFEAFAAVGWVSATDAGTVVIEDYDRIFARNARRRLADAQRKRSGRRAETTKSGPGAVPDAGPARPGPAAPDAVDHLVEAGFTPGDAIDVAAEFPAAEILGACERSRDPAVRNRPAWRHWATA